MKFRIKIKAKGKRAQLNYESCFYAQTIIEADRILHAVASIAKIKMDLGNPSVFEFGYYEKGFQAPEFVVDWQNLELLTVSILGSEHNKRYHQRANVKPGIEPYYTGVGEYYVMKKEKNDEN